MRHIPMHPFARPLVRFRACALAGVARSLVLCVSLVALCGMLLPAVAVAPATAGSNMPQSATRLTQSTRERATPARAQARKRTRGRAKGCIGIWRMMHRTLTPAGPCRLLYDVIYHPL